MTQQDTFESCSEILPSSSSPEMMVSAASKTVSDVTVPPHDDDEEGSLLPADDDGPLLEDEAIPQNKQTIHPTSTYSSMKQITRGPGRRLVEYFVVVSSLPSKKDSSAVTLSPNVSFESHFDEIPQNVSIEYDVEDEFNFEPVITARYPLEDHHGNPLHQSVACFCHPSGIIQLKSKPCMPKIHYFAMTGGRGTLMYGVCLTLHEPFSVKMKSSQETVDMYIPKCICILSAYPYLVAFREYLTQLDRLLKRGNMKIPVERYIVNLCSEIPAAPSGSFEVQITILDSVIRIWSPPHNQPIAWVSLPFSHLFECLDIENIITAWHALALERQILVVSTQLTLLTTCCEILVSLLFPMRWSHAYIPLLPKFLCPILSAPMSFLIGLDKQYLTDAFVHLSSECIVIDLDTNQIQVGPTTPPVPKLPMALKQHLLQKLNDNAGMIFREARSLRKEDNFSERGQHLLSHVKVMADHMWESKLCLFDEAFHLAYTPEQSRNHDFLNGNDNSALEFDEQDSLNPILPIYHLQANSKVRKQSRWDAVQEAFLEVYIDLLSTYRRCLVFPSKDDKLNSDGSSAGSGYSNAGFRSREFIKSQRNDKRPFLRELIKTQMFDEFVTKRLYGVSASDIVFFDNAIDRFNRRKSAVSSDNGSVSNSISSGIGNMVIESSVKRLVNRVTGSSDVLVENDEPLLQSARVHRKLKTIVPPEPSGEGLQDDEDDLGIGFTYSTFPTKFDKDLFIMPRPLPPAVLAEFDRQQDDAAKFRRRLKSSLKRRDAADALQEKISPEATTFTVFLLAFTSSIGKELLDFSNNLHECEDERHILASYTADTTDCDSEITPVVEETKDSHQEDRVRSEMRFKRTISSSRIEEAKARASAQLNLAFEVLDIMKEREIKVDPVAYKCLIDACGRCGDTDRATQLLTRMHEDGIVADGVVYSCLVSAFSVENTYGNLLNSTEDLPKWANGASVKLNWNSLQKTNLGESQNDVLDEDAISGVSSKRAIMLRKRISRYIENRLGNKDEGIKEKKINAAEILGDTPTKERFVTETVANQIGFGENLLEIVYPDISIDTDDERCPKCDTMMIDDDVVAGWIPDPQSYTTTCMTCSYKFVPKFRVQSTSQTFLGSKGAGTPLICERLSPWVLEKELRTKMHDVQGAEDLLDPKWRENENKNSVLWWNLVLSFMRYRLPFTFLLQGSFPQDLISPMPSMIEENQSNEEMGADSFDATEQIIIS